ncbi:MAG: phosphohistidine phosphatase [Frankiales bacterium]|nr:phosphohistidine phosphatase [Frankiales bacterium]
MDDHDRPLNARGRRSAAEVAETLRRKKIHPDLVLVSSAERTTETVERLGLDVEVSSERRLYLADAKKLLNRLRVLPDNVNTVLVVGHNPGIEQLVVALSRPEDKPLEGMPTAALVGLTVDAATWSNLEEHTATPVGRWLHAGEKKK